MSFTISLHTLVDPKSVGSLDCQYLRDFYLKHSTAYGIWVIDTGLDHRDAIDSMHELSKWRFKSRVKDLDEFRSLCFNGFKPDDYVFASLDSDGAKFIRRENQRKMDDICAKMTPIGYEFPDRKNIDEKLNGEANQEQLDLICGDYWKDAVVIPEDKLSWCFPERDCIIQGKELISTNAHPNSLFFRDYRDSSIKIVFLPETFDDDIVKYFYYDKQYAERLRRKFEKKFVQGRTFLFYSW